MLFSNSTCKLLRGYSGKNVGEAKVQQAISVEAFHGGDNCLGVFVQGRTIQG